MKKAITKIIFGICGLILTPTAAHAAYDSKTDLFRAFGQAGFDHVMEMPSNDFSTGGPNIRVHIIDPSGTSQETTLAAYGHGEEIRRAELDYKLPGSLNSLIRGDQFAQAYQIGEIFLCYRTSTIRGTRTASCYLFPTSVNDVVRALRAL